MKKPSASVSKITFSSGQEFTFRPKEKIIIVGSNNSGKSQTLREIVAYVSEGEKARPVVLSSLELEKNGTADELKEYLDNNATITDKHYNYKNWRFYADHTRMWGQPFLQHNLASGFIKNIDANNRLTICQLQQSVSDTDQRSAPQHLLYDSEALMRRISSLFRQAFGQDLMINYRGGSVIPIHVGQIPSSDLGHPVSDPYVEAVKKNPPLHEQGDGVKSFAGILFEAVVSDIDITMIDEPEAFLHPPQMRRLGGILASEVKGQLFVATHSSDIMRGFLEGTKGSVRMLRIRREGNKNFVAEAAPDTVKELWNTPVLRYSNALEGVFHEQAILCEDHSDCRLFNAVADYLSETQAARWLDTVYVPTGGKHAIPTIANILRKIGVPTKAVFDIDLLRSQDDLKKSVEAFGGEWAEFEEVWRKVNAAVSDGMPIKTNQEIKQFIKQIVDAAEPENLPKGDIIEAMKQGSAWSIVKKVGPAGLPRGDARKNYNALTEKLEEIGIYLVPVGEIEEFCPEMGVHGPKFVNKVLAEMSLADEKLQGLRSFVTKFHNGQHAPI
ncbi:AAA domain-containing protein, putative AbiEii toxin, Type IV TA system [Paracoccus aminovorans]|uniref:AAA domain-containing protein, putative AbiEii toxin, Type IV TA system n=2 Tax=Paracoccus aminovorans TaxID=34004 RepID=A0A1I3C0R9_9RHOB|nr:hypothetical protein JCM7685_2503 [Paracoccus aminovorans]SFH68165.1 AAA domain-containing protein, putative AbiEii toxin, Type IV TA system [Paracoccus aminovorans]